MSKQTQAGRWRDKAVTSGALPLTLQLEELGRGDLAVAGGKGANLGELIRAGFPFRRVSW